MRASSAHTVRLLASLMGYALSRYAFWRLIFFFARTLMSMTSSTSLSSRLFHVMWAFSISPLVMAMMTDCRARRAAGVGGFSVTVASGRG